MSIALWAKVEALEKRVESLERERAAARRTLAAQAEANRAAGDELKAEIEAIVTQHPGGDLLRPRQIVGALKRSVSVRRVQEILKEIRAESAASRS